MHVDDDIAVMAGLGSTVTVTVNVPPLQLPDNGVTVYVAVWAVLVGFVRVPLMLVGEPLLAAPPVKPPVTTGAGQLYVVPTSTIPFTPFTGVAEKPFPLHIVDVIAVMAEVGLTVTVTVKLLPVQLPDVGVTV